MINLFQNAKIGNIDTSGKIVNSTSTNVSFAARPFVNGTGLLLSGEAAPSGIYGSQWTTTGSKIYYNSGNIGINNSNPLYKLDISGTIGNSNGGLNFATSGIQLLVTGGTNSGVNTGIIGIWISGVSPSIPNPYTGAPQTGWIAQFPNDLTLPNRIARVTGSEFASALYWRIYFDSSFVISYPHTYYSNPNVNIIPYGGGNVGIANNNPKYTLDVSGQGNFSSGLYVNGKAVSTGEPIAVALSGSVVLLTGEQTITGVKTFKDAIVVSGAVGTNSVTLSGGYAILSDGAGVYSTFLPGQFAVSGAGKSLLFGGGGGLSVQSDAAFSNRPTVNGTGVLLIGEASSATVSDVVYTTGAQTISGVKTFKDNIFTSGDLFVNGGSIQNAGSELTLSSQGSNDLVLYSASNNIVFKTLDAPVAGGLTLAMAGSSLQTLTAPDTLEVIAGDNLAGNLEFSAYDSVIINAGGSSADYINLLGGKVGIGTSSPAYDLDVNGSANVTNGLFVSGELNLAAIKNSGSFTIGSNPFYVYTGASAETGTMPPISSSIGRTYFLKNRGAGTFTISGSGSDKFYYTGVATGSIPMINGKGFTLINDGTYWDVIS